MAQTLVAPIPEPDGLRRWTVEEFDALPDGLFAEGERVELIEGLIYTEIGQNLPHIAALRRIIEALRAVFGAGFNVSGQLPVQLDHANKVEPDVLVLRGSVEDYDHRFPDPATDMVVLVEVSDTSLGRDTGLKARLYASHGVPEYWVVNVAARTVEVRREPRPGGYAETRVYEEGESVPAGGKAVPVADVLPKAA